MVNTLQRLILVDEGSKGQLSDIVEKLAIRQGQVVGRYLGIFFPLPIIERATEVTLDDFPYLSTLMSAVFS